MFSFSQPTQSTPPHSTAKLNHPYLLVGGPRGGVRSASRRRAGAPAEGAAVARRKPLPVCERSGCGEPAAYGVLAALSQRPPACPVQGIRGFFLALQPIMVKCVFLSLLFSLF